MVRDGRLSYLFFSELYDPFEAPDDELLKFRCRKDRFQLDGQINLTKKDVVNLLTLKFSEWRYEREQRIMTLLKIAIKDANMHHEPVYVHQLSLAATKFGVTKTKHKLINI